MVKSLLKKGLSATLLKKGLTENPGNNVIGLVKSRNATLLKKGLTENLLKKGLTENLLKKGLTENSSNNVVGVVKQRNGCRSTVAVKQADLETKGNKGTEVLSGGLISQSHFQGGYFSFRQVTVLR